MQESYVPSHCADCYHNRASVAQQPAVVDERLAYMVDDRLAYMVQWTILHYLGKYLMHLSPKSKWNTAPKPPEEERDELRDAGDRDETREEKWSLRSIAKEIAKKQGYSFKQVRSAIPFVIDHLNPRKLPKAFRTKADLILEARAFLNTQQSNEIQ